MKNGAQNKGKLCIKWYGVAGANGWLLKSEIAVLRPPLEILNFLPWATANFYFQEQLNVNQIYESL